MSSKRTACTIAIVFSWLIGSAVSSAAGRHCHRQKPCFQVSGCQSTTVAANTVLISIVLLEHRREHLVVRIHVTNCTSHAIAWDSEFASFVDWDLRSDDGSRIEPTSIKRLDPIDLSLNKSRFVTI